MIADDGLALLTSTGPTLLSLFVGQLPTGRTVEIKVNGADWHSPWVRDLPPAGSDLPIVLLRELAVRAPLEPPPAPEHAAVQRTLVGLASGTARAAGPGAGPGYGPLTLQQVNDVVPLARCGCGGTWLLRLDDAHRGTVWVDAAVRADQPWTQWDPSACASTGVCSAGGLGRRPCQGCVVLASRLGLAADVFVPGIPSRRA